MHRFFFDPGNRSGETVTLSEEESRHITRVLRLKVGHEIELFDGSGTLYYGVLAVIDRRVVAHLSGIASTCRGDSKVVWVQQGLLKGEKMDMVVQKCTELGVAGITPFHSSRCQGKLDAGLARKKHERWQRISVAACKQCLRLQPMQLDEPQRFNDLLEKRAAGDDGTLRLLFWEEERNVHLQDVAAIDTAPSINLMCGPEGGFSPDEVEAARSIGWQTVSLGERILRAETATLSAVSIVQYLAGNLRRKR
ncbi:MAG: 16S rRNA (uracil(1498)-N(3))-methyltransferase [Desulforhopalus sp.]